MYYYPPVIIEYKDTIVALNLLMMWCYIFIKGTMGLGDIYIYII